MASRTILALAAAVIALACGPANVGAQGPSLPAFETSGDTAFDAWRADFAARALARGRNPDVVRRLLSGISPDPRVVELDQRQPEFVAPVWDYVNARVSDNRVNAGIALKTEIASTLWAVEQRYGVDQDIILGIWGLESNYGSVPLNYTAPQALATLAFEGRRRAQFEGYLLSLFEMVERGLATPAELRSSWAGAMGQPQFMPDVYLSIAVDWDNDGKRDIWNNRADTAASIAHYLQDRGWRANEPVFDEVTLPDGFNYALADGSQRTVADWQARGVRRTDGQDWSTSDRALTSQLFLPAGAQGPALLLHPNFAVIRRYNNSDRYALVVALLARRFEGRSGLVARWPTHLASLDRDQMFELQTLLNSLGYTAGAPDGLFGANTRMAVRAYQTARNQTADGFPTLQLLVALRRQAGVTADPPTPAPTRVRALDRDGIRELQRLLTRLGYRPGRADGRIGPATRAAIRAFERREGMSITGRATTVVLEAARDARRGR